MEILTLLGVIVLIISFLPIGIKRLIRLKKTRSNWLYYVVNISSIVLFLVLVFEYILNLNNQYLTGYKTRNFLIIGLSLLFIVHYLMTFYKNKTYLFFVQFLLVTKVFTTTIISVVNLSNFENFMLYQDHEFRIEKNWDLMGTNTFLPKVYKKNGVIESQIQLEYAEGFGYDYFHNLDKSEIIDYTISESDSLIHVQFTFKDGSFVNTLGRK